MNSNPFSLLSWTTEKRVAYLNDFSCAFFYIFVMSHQAPPPGSTCHLSCWERLQLSAPSGSAQLPKATSPEVMTLPGSLIQ